MILPSFGLNLLFNDLILNESSSAFFNFIINNLFNLSFMITKNCLKLKDKIIPRKNEASIESRALTKIMKISKLYQIIKFKKSDENLKNIRIPLLSILSPKFGYFHKYKSFENFWGLWCFYPSLKYKEPKYIIIYVHGGGYIAGDINNNIGLGDYLSMYLKCPIFLPQYRLNPEYKINDSISDIIESINYIKNKFPKSKIFCIGDSAGAGLVSLTIQRLNKQQKNIINKCVLWSPMFSILYNKRLYKNLQKKEKYIYHKNLEFCCDLIIDNNKNYHLEDISSFHGNWNNFPPTRIVVDKSEIFYNEVNIIKNKLSMNSCNLNYIETNNLFHAFPLYWKYLPEARNEIKMIKEFLTN